MTLVEVVVVVLLLILISSTASARFGMLDSYRQKSALRQLVNTWELVASDALLRGESYRLIFNLENQSYIVRREIPPEQGEFRNVDTLAGFRSKMKYNQEREEREPIKGVKESFAAEAIREGNSLDAQYYQTFFRDSDAQVNLGPPLNFPRLAETQQLPAGLTIRDVMVGDELYDSGSVFLRFTANGGVDFGVIHLVRSSGVVTAFMNPASGKVKMEDGDKKFEWLLGKRGK